MWQYIFFLVGEAGVRCHLESCVKVGRKQASREAREV
jgi:hypothetical protein